MILLVRLLISEAQRKLSKSQHKPDNPAQRIGKSDNSSVCSCVGLFNGRRFSFERTQIPPPAHTDPAAERLQIQPGNRSIGCLDVINTHEAIFLCTRTKSSASTRRCGLLSASKSSLGTTASGQSTASHGPHFPHAHMSQRIRILAHVYPHKSPILQQKGNARAACWTNVSSTPNAE